MDNNFTKSVIEPAWEIARKADKIKKFNFFPALLSTIYLTIIIIYQTAFTYIEVFDKKDVFFRLVLNFFHKDYFIESVITVIILFVMYLLLTPIAEWALISYIRAYDNKNINNYKTSYCIWEWIHSFWHLFEYDNLTWVIRLLTITTSFIFAIRIFWFEYIHLIWIVYMIYLFLALLLNILFAYSRFYIIIEWQSPFKAISSSVRLSFLNFTETVKLFFSIMLLYLRIIFTALFTLLFPLILSVIFTYFTSKIFLAIAVIFLIIIFISFLIFITHINSVVSIFVNSIWYFSFKKFNKIEKEWRQEKQEE